MHDCLIIGGGVIGLSLAWELSRRGLSTIVLDQSELGREASWAGAGMLPPGNLVLAKSPEARLKSASNELWPDWSEALRCDTGIDNGFRVCGGFETRFGGSPDELAQEVAGWLAAGVECVSLSPQSARDLEPTLGPELSSVYLLPQFAQVRNPRHLKALQAACVNNHVELRSATPVRQLVWEGDRVVAVQTHAERLAARHFVVAAGAWSEQLLADRGRAPKVRPMRGQMVLLNSSPSALRRVVNIGSHYLVPRGDGRILVGSTEETVGYDRRTTAAGVGSLLALVAQVAPGLGSAAIERCWAGLRPQSIDGLPYLGRMPGVENLLVATGHFRAGLQLSPITAVVCAELICGEATSISLEGLAVDREASAAIEASHRNKAANE